MNIHVQFGLIIFVVSEKKAFEYFPIGSNVNLCPVVAAILVEKWKTNGGIIGSKAKSCCNGV
jgi:hypothetical protein